MHDTIRTALILGICALVGVSAVFGYVFRQHNARTNERIETLERQLSLLSTTLSSIEGALGSYAEKSELAEISQLTEASLKTLEENLTPIDLPSLISTWEPYVYKLECMFEREDGSEDTSRGSAHVGMKNSTRRFVTSAHVLEEEDQELQSCEITHPKKPTEITIRESSTITDDEVDIAYGYIAEFVDTLPEAKLCTHIPELGDSIVVLGYPKIGSETTVTATEGIIAGFEDPFYITTAKVDRGNSGGIAVDIEKDCLIGIPTLTLRGGAEALARLLPITSAP